jgi:hypothetical protein
MAGLNINCKGYDQKLPELLITMFQRMVGDTCARMCAGVLVLVFVFVFAFAFAFAFVFVFVCASASARVRVRAYARVCARVCHDDKV